MIVTYSQMHRTDTYSQHNLIILPVWLNSWVFVYQLSGCGFENPVAVTQTSDIAPVLRKQFLDIQATIECRFPLKHVHDMIVTYSQMYHTYKYSQQSCIILPAWLNGWRFVHKLSGCGFEFHCCHLDNFYLVIFLIN